jgi:hypothetical protein
MLPFSASCRSLILNAFAPDNIFGRHNDLAFRAIDLADLARAVSLMPPLLEAEHVDVEPNCTVQFSNEEHGTCVPPVSDLLSDGCLAHVGS